MKVTNSTSQLRTRKNLLEVLQVHSKHASFWCVCEKEYVCVSTYVQMYVSMWVCVLTHTFICAYMHMKVIGQLRVSS